MSVEGSLVFYGGVCVSVCVCVALFVCVWIYHRYVIVCGCECVSEHCRLIGGSFYDPFIKDNNAVGKFINCW